MPRGEKRRWWLERDPLRGGREFTLHFPERASAGFVADQRLTALWRLVQWMRIRLERERAESTIFMAKIIVSRESINTLRFIVADADAAVMDERCREEEMRVECEAYYAELERLRDVVCDEDIDSIDRVLGVRDPGVDTDDTAVGDDAGTEE